MTKEEILAMEAGRELDALVGLKLGLVTAIVAGGYMSNGADLDDTHEKYGMKSLLPKYSTDIAEASVMEETLYAMSTTMGMTYALHLLDIMKIGTDRRLSNIAKLIRATPEQRCKAALLSVMDS